MKLLDSNIYISEKQSNQTFRKKRNTIDSVRVVNKNGFEALVEDLKGFRRNSELYSYNIVLKPARLAPLS